MRRDLEMACFLSSHSPLTAKYGTKIDKPWNKIFPYVYPRNRHIFIFSDNIVKDYCL
jgi:hypothetical protein